jgi:hypothetical protein
LERESNIVLPEFASQPPDMIAEGNDGAEQSAHKHVTRKMSRIDHGVG